MEIKILPKSCLGVLLGFVGMILTVIIIATCSESEGSMYDEVINAKDFDKWYECSKYLDKHPTGKHVNEVSQIFLEELKKDGRIDWIYKYGVHYSHLPIGRKIKDLAYELAVTKNTFEDWQSYIEVADSVDIKDAYLYLESF